MHCKSLLALIFVSQPLSQSARIEVTAGGSVGEPTYQFSDASGSKVATFTANVTNGKITAAGVGSEGGVIEATNLQTPSADLNGLAVSLAAAQATIASLNATIASLQQANAARNFFYHVHQGVCSSGALYDFGGVSTSEGVQDVESCAAACLQYNNDLDAYGLTTDDAGISMLGQRCAFFRLKDKKYQSGEVNDHGQCTLFAASSWRTCSDYGHAGMGNWRYYYFGRGIPRVQGPNLGDGF